MVKNTKRDDDFLRFFFSFSFEKKTTTAHRERKKETDTYTRNLVLSEHVYHSLVI